MTNRLAVLSARVTMIAALLTAISMHAQTAPAWKQYPYPADGFAVFAPIEPVYSNRVQTTDVGNVEIHTYAIKLNENSVVMISSSQVRGLDKESAKDRLQKAKDGALKAGSATLVSEKEITLGSYPGLQYEATSQGLHVRARMYIVKDRLFQLLDICPLSSPFPEDAERITSSFKLVGT